MSDTLSSSNRTWVSVTTALAFIILGITGILMLLHINISFLPVKFLHIAMGIVFVIVGLIHLVLNWRPFTTHLGRRAAVIALAAGILLCIALSLFGPEDRKGGPPGITDNGQNGHRYGVVGD